MARVGAATISPTSARSAAHAGSEKLGATGRPLTEKPLDPRGPPAGVPPGGRSQSQLRRNHSRRPAGTATIATKVIPSQKSLS